MPRERKQFALDRLLVDRRCKEHIHLSGAEIGHSCLQGGESGLAGLLGREKNAVIKEKDAVIEEKDIVIEEKNAILERQQREIEELKQKLEQLQ